MDDQDQADFVADGIAGVKAALAAEPHRGMPGFRDLEVVTGAILQHLANWRPRDRDPRRDPYADEGLTGSPQQGGGGPQGLTGSGSAEA